MADEQEIAEKLNNFFVDAIENLNIESFIQTANDDDPCNFIEDIVKKYNQHPSIIKIKQYVSIDNKFSFSETTNQQFQVQIKSLNPKKATVENDMPSKMLKN